MSYTDPNYVLAKATIDVLAESQKKLDIPPLNPYWVFPEFPQSRELLVRRAAQALTDLVRFDSRVATKTKSP